VVQQIAHLGQVGQVGGKAPRRRTQLRDQARELHCASAGDCESTTPRCQFMSDRAPDASGGAGKQNASTIESHGHQKR